MKYVTEIGYFGPTTNVADAPISDAAVGSILASLDTLPRRQPTAAVLPFPVARGPHGEPLRFIAVERNS